MKVEKVLGGSIIKYNNELLGVVRQLGTASSNMVDCINKESNPVVILKGTEIELIADPLSVIEYWFEDLENQ